jgi:hypothetical protein
MGQQNNSGRNATLDENKRRAAGRQQTNSPERQAIRDEPFEKGKTAGAFGKSGVANRRRGSEGKGAGAGGGGGADASDSKSNVLNVGTSTRGMRTRKR